eukprot:1183290-Heterocapsa_arctica.AAC.1
MIKILYKSDTNVIQQVIQKLSKEATGHHGGPRETPGDNGGPQREATGANVDFAATVLKP